MSQLHPDSPDAPASPLRRQIIAGAGLLGGALAADLARGASLARAPHVTDAPTSGGSLQDSYPYLGVRQQGVTTPRPAAGMVAAFDVLAVDRAGLERLFRRLTDRIAFLTQGGPVPQSNPDYPPADSGILGPVVTPDGLTVTISVGASLFDNRFGLATIKPRELVTMTGFPNDALVERLCHGDLLLQFCANTSDTNIHALRDIVKNVPDLLMLRWKQEGTVPVVTLAAGRRPESARNLLGFRDGSANPDSTDAAMMDRVVWVGTKAGEPTWAANGSYQVVRIIRNFVERWDRTPLQEQESIIGRRKANGAPFDGRTEFDVPDYAADPEGKKTPLDAHIRLANDRSVAAQKRLILRRPFNYSNGVAPNGQLEMGLLFIAYQASLNDGFIAVQEKLNGEPLEEYIKPIGGGYFFVLPGVPGEGDFLGSTLLQA
ncbi:MAG TPA: iron uptake transporter deferrochelatase/peroxidase subunit [Trinickia sp.]|jgi:deferrochelatase/peroxidase EfeB|uniref:iron uptake transporter deferrochelatase/peroxidase subunit n=1 Tax=Trinickia sp. TaxID=2571163 RepID=UPI002C4C3145|nr:iron uptake transporter deferrochelatase/peroxidase subunit [Trinickia sp.]HTI18025.1 iron uptake transporter deferrochelatase/peroxidase subunit [Trinickia sp.]